VREEEKLKDQNTHIRCNQEINDQQCKPIEVGVDE
jgi:hypothetical protein